MKNTKHIKITTLFAILFSLIIISPSIAQKKERTRVRAYYEKLANSNKEIKVILTTGSGKRMKGVANTDILISSIGGEEEKDLAIIQTDTAGVAFLQIEDGYAFDMDEDGYVVLNAEFDGNDSLRSSKRKIEFMDLDLEVAFEVVDSVRIVKVTAMKDSAGVKSPVEEIEVQVGVQRMHSILFLETVETDEDGIGEYEFPMDVPGDETGNLNFVIKVYEDDDFGTVITNAEQKWGTIVDYSITGNGRTLFGDEAPLWMIIGVFIVLGGAWYHFIWAIIKVWKIKKLGNLEES